MKAQKHVVVMMGGTSSEHDISIKSGTKVLEFLDQEIYTVSSIEITREGEWVFSDTPGEYVEFSRAIPRLRDMHPDCVFIALHGSFGEDGRIQGLLDLMNIPYTGSGCAASGLAMDKILSKRVMKQVGVTVPDEIIITLKEWKADREGNTERITSTLGFPCIVKNPVQGSSLGLTFPQTEAEFADAVEQVLGFGDTLMVERMVHGREITCGVISMHETGELVALPVTEIKPVEAAFFDYQAKYTPGATEKITPADIPDEVRDRIQAISLKAHETIGCSGFSRSDMILSDKELVWLEVNTIPGMTSTSLLPQGALEVGMSYAELLMNIIEDALQTS
jgi:D-alanine-D-alanine ligase